MKRRIRTTILFAAGGLVVLWYTGATGALPILATGPDADVTEEGLHRVHPSIMEAAWVRPDLDLSVYTRILLMPTAVQFREVAERNFNARTRIGVSEFPLDDEKKKWFREVWRRAVDARFAQEQSYEFYDGVGPNVLVVQGFLVDVVSHIPPEDVGSGFTYIRDPWIASIVLELRDGTTAELLARTMDRRFAEGFMDSGTVWVRTEDLVERWAQVLSVRLKQLSDLGEQGRNTPTWARSAIEAACPLARGNTRDRWWCSKAGRR